MMLSSVDREAQQVVLTWMALQYTDKGLPIWTLETVSEQHRDVIRKYKGVKPWRNCLTCGAEYSSTKLYRCTGCIKGGVWDAARHCSVSCQKKGWSEHAPSCVELRSAYNAFSKGCSKDGLFDLLRSFRVFRRWNNALRGFSRPIEWAARQAFFYCEIANPRHTQITLFMEPTRKKIGKESSEVTILLDYFEFTPHKWNIKGECEDRPVGQYKFDGDGGIETQGWVYLDDAEGEILAPILPQWPYVYALCCWMGDFHPEMTRARLEILVDAIRKFPDPDGLLATFVPPKFTGKWSMDHVKFAEWRALMEPVISSL